MANCRLTTGEIRRSTIWSLVKAGILQVNQIEWKSRLSRYHLTTYLYLKLQTFSRITAQFHINNPLDIIARDIWWNTADPPTLYFVSLWNLCSDSGDIRMCWYILKKRGWGWNASKFGKIHAKHTYVADRKDLVYRKRKRDHWEKSSVGSKIYMYMY